MTLRTKLEISDWLKILGFALTQGVMLLIFGITMRKDVDAEMIRNDRRDKQIERVEQKVDALLIINSQVGVINQKIEDIARRIDKLETFKK